MNSRFPSRKHTCPATNGAGIFIGGQMTDQEFIRKTEEMIADLVAGVDKNTPYRVVSIYRKSHNDIQLGIELKPNRQEVPVTGEVKS
jgi:hypothetical protein